MAAFPKADIQNLRFGAEAMSAYSFYPGIADHLNWPILGQGVSHGKGEKIQAIQSGV